MALLVSNYRVGTTVFQVLLFRRPFLFIFQLQKYKFCKHFWQYLLFKKSNYILSCFNMILLFLKVLINHICVISNKHIVTFPEIFVVVFSSRMLMGSPLVPIITEFAMIVNLSTNAWNFFHIYFLLAFLSCVCEIFTGFLFLNQFESWLFQLQMFQIIFWVYTKKQSSF